MIHFIKIMKKIIFLLLLQMVSFALLSQKHKMVLDPLNTNGYFMFDPQGVEYENCLIDIYKVTIKEDGTTTASLESQLNLGKRNFAFIPEEYRNSDPNADYSFNYLLKAYNSNNDIVIDDTYQGLCAGCWSEFICDWTCVGDDYSWSVEKWNSNPPAVTLTHGPISYMYMTSEFFYGQFQNWVNLNGLTYYGCGGCDEVDGVNVIVASGWQGDVWFPPGTIGVRKGLGPWGEDYGKFVPLVNVSGHPYCGSQNSDVIDFFNSFEVLNEPLECHPAINGGGEGTGWDNPDDCFGEVENWANCIEELATELMTSDVEGGGQGVSGSGNPITDVVISSWDGTTCKPVYTFSGYDMPYVAGKFYFPSVSFEPGLYNIQVVGADGKSRFAFAECTKAVSFNSGDVQHVTAKVFPVPIKNETFELELATTKKVNFEYVLKSYSGQILYSKNYTMEENTQITESVSFINPAGNKFLLNIIQCEDGTIESFTTLTE